MKKACSAVVALVVVVLVSEGSGPWLFSSPMATRPALPSEVAVARAPAAAQVRFAQQMPGSESRSGRQAEMAVPLREIGAGWQALFGLLQWLFPEKFAAGKTDVAAASISRAAGAWQICFAFNLLASSRLGVRAAAGSGLFAAACTALVIIPVWDTLGREKPSQAFAVVLFAALGRLTLAGSVSPFVAAAAYLVPGLLIFSLPQGTTELYQLSASVSKVGLAALRQYGAAITMSGVYLAALAAGVAQPAAFAASFAARALMSAVGVADASLVFPRAGAIGSMLLSAALAGLALFRGL